MSPGASRGHLAVPELGSALGRLTAPGAAAPWLEPVRLQLVTGLFEARGHARDAAEEDHLTGARQALGSDVWRRLWDEACSEACRLVVEDAQRTLTAAADEARLPARRRRRLLLDAAERHAILGRLGAAGADLQSAAEHLTEAGPARWAGELTEQARRMERAWIELERVARDEVEAWHREAERVRAWRRPRWPLWLATVVVLSLATYLGLVLGGYIPVPRLLAPVADLLWGRR